MTFHYTNSLIGEDLFILQANAEKTSRAVKEKLGTLRGRSTIAITQYLGRISPEFKQHIAATRLLNQAVKTIQSEGKAPIPATVIQTLDESLKLITQLAGNIHDPKFVNSPLDPNCCYLDKHRLLLSDSRKSACDIPKTHTSWYLNLGLLMNIYQRTEDPELKKEIAFLAIHYLAKVAPYGFEELNLPIETERKLSQMFHHGFIEPGVSYNRESPIFDPYLSPEISAKITPASGNLLFVLGTKDIEEFLALWFSMLPTEGENLSLLWSNEIERLVSPHFEQILKEDFADYIDPPLFLDLTPFLERFLYTSSREGNCLFEEKLNFLRDHLDKAIHIVAEKLITRNPDANRTPEATQRLIVFLRSNITGIIRGQIQSSAFLKILPLFEDPLALELPQNACILKNYITESRNFARHLAETNAIRAKVKLVDFINGTAIRMTPAEGRRALLEFIPFENLLELNGHSMVFFSDDGPNVRLYKQPSEIIRTRIFKNFEAEVTTNKKLIIEHPYLKVLGKSTVDLVKGLVKEMSGEKWERLNSDPDKRQIIQSSLFCLLQHLAKAENNLTDFGTFTQAIELVHYEMSTLLTLFSPFIPEDFEPIYLQQLQCIPENLQRHVQAGLTKSSMNTFTGINVALRKMLDHLYRVYQPESHFEIIRSMENDDSLTEALANPRDSADLYVCEFNHNINLDPNHAKYQSSHLVDEVDALLRSKPSTTHLTVAVDTTIDYVNSPKVFSLLSHFSREIEDGKLQFIFYLSGQKFGILGMDNHYGSPFYRVSNGDHWKPFENLSRAAVHRTDLLSTQWFCLVNKYAPEATDEHRRLIFNNTQLILASVPDTLKPGNPSPIKICTVEEGVDSCFIDIKITGEKGNQITDDLKQSLYQKFADKNARIHTRGGYGYCNPNVCFFPFPDSAISGGTMRINPGLDKRETQLIIEFLQEVASKYAS